MKLLKIALSFIALVAAALGVAQATGLLHWNVAVVGLVMAGSTLLGTFGIVPFTLTVTEHRVCAGIAAFAAAVGSAHAAGTIPGSPVVFNIIAVGAALLSILGRWDDPSTPSPAKAPTPPAPPVTDPPKAA
jgi:hypothetical protein